MSDTIEVGDRVQYQQRGHQKGTFVSGIVMEIKDMSDGPMAVMRSDLGGKVFALVAKLNKVDDSSSLRRAAESSGEGLNRV